jgi:hypothetical protein
LATQVDIAPSLGHSIVTAQGLAGGYDAIDDRRFWSAGLQEGALSALAYKVSQRGAGANMSVDVDADDAGGFLVKGDAVTAQGLYFVPPHSGTINLDVAANASGNPRIDSVVLEAKDTTHDASGLTVARARIITGTPTSGATLDNRSGAPALPNGAARLADILVANGAASITDAVIRDKRTMARGAFVSSERTTDQIWGAANTTIADFDFSIECSGVPVEVTLSPVRYDNATGISNIGAVRILIDEVTAAHTEAGAANGSSGSLPGLYVCRRTLSAGRHRFRAIYHAGGDGSGTSDLGASLAPVFFSVREVLAEHAAQ